MGLSIKLRQLYLRVITTWPGEAKPPGTIRLPGGSFVRVRRLGLYELDSVAFSDAGPFTYTYELSGGKTKEAFYDISQWPEPPRAPNIPEEVCTPESYEKALWRVYNLYQSALLHRIKQVEAAELYAHDVARYILAHCLSDVDRPLVETAGDYEAVYGAAICPEVSLDDIEAALSQTFKASFDNEPILDQLFKDKGGSGKVDALRQWAGQARQAWGLDKVKWAALSIKDRAEMVVTVKLSSWLESLEWQKREKERK